ncbi:hypothetical protein F5B18DRAFT_651156 [Nemania serpens]|nr:hypothetical protein F5B18DRAFT_651156 [Nemania serpens]
MTPTRHAANAGERAPRFRGQRKQHAVRDPIFVAALLARGVSTLARPRTDSPSQARTGASAGREASSGLSAAPDLIRASPLPAVDAPAAWNRVRTSPGAKALVPAPLGPDGISSIQAC